VNSLEANRKPVLSLVTLEANRSLLPTCNNILYQSKQRKKFDGLMKALPKYKKKLVVSDTHKKAYLDGFMSDFSVFDEEDTIDEAYVTTLVHTLLEVKRRKSLSGLADEDKGQLLNYINILIEH
jgi:hypothetical protein